jgi:hypothetical protein
MSQKPLPMPRLLSLLSSALSGAILGNLHAGALDLPKRYSYTCTPTECRSRTGLAGLSFAHVESAFQTNPLRR